MNELSHALDMIVKLLKKDPHSTPTILSQLSTSTPIEIVQLYEWMLKEQLPIGAFNCFKELFKIPGKHPLLVHLLVNTPVIPVELVNSWLPNLTETDLLILLEQLLIKRKVQSEFTLIFNHVLLFFCDHLSTKQKAESALYQWSHKPYAKELVLHILNNPECLYSLTQANSAVYTWLTWSDFSTPLKYRIDAVLNYMLLSADDIKQNALILLTHYADHPEKLYTLFQSINKSKANRTSIGEHNVLLLKQACWSLLRPEDSYNETAFLALFNSSKNDLLAALYPLVNQEQAHYSPYQQAIWLSQRAECLQEPSSADQWIALLIHSLQDKTLANWQKASLWLEKKHQIVQLVFLKKLIEAASNPIFSQQSYQLIARCSQLTHYINDFNEQELSWLLQYSPTEKMDSWLELIEQRHKKQSIHLGRFFSLLPVNRTLFAQILNRELFTEPLVIAELFAELHLQTDCSAHLMSLQQLMNTKDKIWISQFLNAVSSKITKVNHHLTALFLINSVLLNKENALSSEEPQDRKIISDYLNLILLLTKLSQKEEHLAELKQLAFNVLFTFVTKDEAWAKFIFSEPVVASILLISLSTIHYNQPFMVEAHPITDLLMDPAINYITVETKQHELMQRFIPILLLHPPKHLDAQQCTLLFNWLAPEHKSALAQAILTLPIYQEVHQHILGLLTPFVPIHDLYELFIRHQDRSLLNELIIHPQAYQEFSAGQWNHLFTALSAAEFISILSNQQLPLSIRSKSLQGFFKAFHLKAPLLAAQLKKWNSTAEQVLFLANSTFDEKYYDLLDDTLQQSGYVLTLTPELLAQITLNPHSYLHKKIKETLTEQALLINSQVLHQLPVEEQGAAFKNQTLEAERINALSTLLVPFNAQNSQVQPLLHSARWQLTVPLIHGGLLAALTFYKEQSTQLQIIEAIEKTPLYQQALKPLLNNEAYNSPLVLTTLYSQLQHYCQLIAPLAQHHTQQIKTVLNCYDQELNALRHFFMPRLYEYFKPEAPLAHWSLVTHGALTTEDELFLSTANAAQAEWSAKIGNNPQLLFTKALLGLLKKPLLDEEEDLQQWVINHALLSPLAADIDKESLDNYLRHIPSSQLATYLYTKYEQITEHQRSFALIGSLKPASVEELLINLSRYELSTLNQLILSCTMLHLTFLKEFIELVKTVKQLGLAKEQVNNLLLSGQHDTQWLLLDLQALEKRIEQTTQQINQLTVLGFSYKPGASANDERLLALAEQFATIPPAVLAQCINSYVPLFTNQDYNAKWFVETIEACINQLVEPSSFINQLDEKTVHFIISTALQQAEQYTPLIEQLINSNHLQLCQLQLQLKRDNLIVANGQQNKWEHLEPYQIGPILTVERLIYFAQPLSELIPFIAHSTNPKDQFSKRSFCANASIYHTLWLLKKTSERSLEPCFNWLFSFNQNNLKNYVGYMEQWQNSDEEKDAGILFNWLRWKTELFTAVYQDSTSLIIGLWIAMIKLRTKM